ncbi:hypothetical protein ACLB2K_008228 [Fragaria x ananassa]
MRPDAGEAKVEIKNIRVKKHFVPFLVFLCLATASTNNVESQNLPFGKKHFVLVHGADHGAWCWYKVATLLKSAGHNVTALDMAASGINPTQVQQVHSFSDYAEPLIEFMASLPPLHRVILVGHSMGGAIISLAMEMFPLRISAAVFATAAMPGPNLTYSAIFAAVNSGASLMDSQFIYDDGQNNPPTSLVFGPKFMSSSLYQLSPPEDLTLAFSLVRPSPLFNEEMKLTKLKYGLVRRVFIASDQDRGYTEQVVRLMISKNPPNEVKVINGSDHMVMFSRPVELFSHLQKIAEIYD